MSKNLQSAQKHYDEAYSLVRAEVERRARKILKAHPNLTEFSMSMGSWCFWDKDGNSVDGNYSGQKYVKPIADLLGEWDDFMKLTGDPMRITADGELIESW